MANIIELTSLDAPELDVYARLTQAQLRNRLEPEKGLFIAESPKVIGTALDAGLTPVSFLMEQRHIEGDAAPLLARFPDVPVYTARREILAELTGYTLTRGVLCTMRRPAPKKPEAVLQNARRVAVLEGVVDATNIGAIFRSAAALGMDAVLLSPTCCDPLTRRAVRCFTPRSGRISIRKNPTRTDTTTTWTSSIKCAPAARSRSLLPITT